MAARKTTKVTAKTASAKVAPKKSKEVSETPKRKFSLSKIQLRTLIFAIAVIAIVVIIGLLKNQFIAATVNGQPITRLELIRELEKKDGQTILESMVTQKLISQEAEKRKITVSSDELKSEISKIEKEIKDQGQNLDLLLTQQGMTRADLDEQIRLQTILKKVVGETKATDDEVDSYIEENQASFPEGTDTNALKPQIKQQLEQEKLNEKIQNLITELQKKAKIEYLLKL